jgi:hypothetical protein
VHEGIGKLFMMQSKSLEKWQLYKRNVRKIFCICDGNADMHNYEPLQALRGFYKPFNMLTMAVFFISVNLHTIKNYNVMFSIGRF